MRSISYTNNSLLRLQARSMVLFISLTTFISCSETVPTISAGNSANGEARACTSPANPSFSIHNGVQASINDIESRFAVRLANGCSGSLISKNFVLTAAHCFNGANVAVEFNVGVQGLNDQVVSIPATAIPHESYGNSSTSNAFYDIGLIELNNPGLVPAFYRTDLVISTGDYLQNAIQSAPIDTRISGYGMLQDNIPNSNQQLHRAVTQLRSVDNGDSIYYEAADGMSAACAGDSGGPSFVLDKQGRIHQVGIMVRAVDSINGRPTCTTGKGYLTNLPMYRSWIANKLEERGDILNPPYQDQDSIVTEPTPEDDQINVPENISDSKSSDVCLY